MSSSRSLVSAKRSTSGYTCCLQSNLLIVCARTANARRTIDCRVESVAVPRAYVRSHDKYAWTVYDHVSRVVGCKEFVGRLAVPVDRPRSNSNNTARFRCTVAGDPDETRCLDVTCRRSPLVSRIVPFAPRDRSPIDTEHFVPLRKRDRFKRTRPVSNDIDPSTRIYTVLRNTCTNVDVWTRTKNQVSTQTVFNSTAHSRGNRQNRYKRHYGCIYNYYYYNN